MKHTIQAMALFLIMNFILGCGSGSEKSGITICFSFQDLETQGWVFAHRTITEILKQKNITVIERNANQDANRQLEQVNDALAQNVDGVIIIPQDGQSALSIIGEANRSGVPIGIYNRPPSDSARAAIVVVANNESISEMTVDFMANEAKKIGKKVTPLILVGDMGDPNAIARRKGFYNVVQKNPDLFNQAIEVPTKWDAPTALANLEAAMQLNPDVDFIFTSSDFMYPQIRAVLEALGKWKGKGEDGHVILGGVDGDENACALMKNGFVDATGVQDLYFEATVLIEALLKAIADKNVKPDQWILDPGFVVTLDNLPEIEQQMWGCRVLADNGK